MSLKEPSAFLTEHTFFCFFLMGYIPMLFREQQKDRFEHQNHEAAV